MTFTQNTAEFVLNLPVNGVPQWNEASIQSNDTSSNCSVVTYVPEDSTKTVSAAAGQNEDLLLVIPNEDDDANTQESSLADTRCCCCPTDVPTCSRYAHLSISSYFVSSSITSFNNASGSTQ